MIKKVQIINILVVLAVIVVGFFMFKQFNKPSESDVPKVVDLTPFKVSVATKPVLGEVDLTQELADQYLARYENVLARVQAADFDTLDGLNEIAQIKRIFGDFDGAIKAWEMANIIRPVNSLSFSNLHRGQRFITVPLQINFQSIWRIYNTKVYR